MSSSGIGKSKRTLLFGPPGISSSAQQIRIYSCALRQLSGILEVYFLPVLFIQLNFTHPSHQKEKTCAMSSDQSRRLSVDKMGLTFTADWALKPEEKKIYKKKS